MLTKLPILIKDTENVISNQGSCQAIADFVNIILQCKTKPNSCYKGETIKYIWISMCHEPARFISISCFYMYFLLKQNPTQPIMSTCKWTHQFPVLYLPPGSRNIFMWYLIKVWRRSPSNPWLQSIGWKYGHDKMATTKILE